MGEGNELMERSSSGSYRLLKKIKEHCRSFVGILHLEI